MGCEWRPRLKPLGAVGWSREEGVSCTSLLGSSENPQAQAFSACQAATVPIPTSLSLHAGSRSCPTASPGAGGGQRPWGADFWLLRSFLAAVSVPEQGWVLPGLGPGRKGQRARGGGGGGGGGGGSDEGRPLAVRLSHSDQISQPGASTPTRDTLVFGVGALV